MPRSAVPTTSPPPSPARSSSSATCASRDGGLLRVFNRGRAKVPAFLEDHAYLLEAYIVLYESTFDERWFVRAVELAETIIIRFLDRERGGFFSTSADHSDLIARRKDLEDAPIPSGASSACYGLLRLAHLSGEVSYEEAALTLIQLLHTVAPEHPLAFGHLLRAIDFIVSPVREVALAGEDVSALAVRRPRGLLPVRGARRRRRRSPSRCWRAASRSTAPRPPTSASASPASCR